MDQSISRDNYKVVGPRYHHKYTLPAVLSFLPSTPCTILDAGCGDGYLAGQFSKIGHAVTAIDISHEGVELGRAAFPNVTFHVASVMDDLFGPLSSSGFDVIFSCEVIEHIYSPNKFLRRTFDLLKPGGLLIITTPYHGY
jgi:2-polyprenyl-3-methyl-5-hydroxy-6-metoxy-1,4-benzoquinol methylase